MCNISNYSIRKRIIDMLNIEQFLHFGHDLFFRLSRAGEKKKVRVCDVKPAERIIEN